ncbi:MAG: tetratricopeptide repeat protein [bacterium]|nr:tetratricopeptide repeat protein [bacterium]
MDKTEIFQILGIEETKEEKIIKNAYRQKLSVTNPEDDPQGFKRLRAAYEEACRLAKETEEEQEAPADETPSGIWVKKAAEIYGSIRRRQDPEEWNRLFGDDCFLSLEEEENCRIKLLRFLMDHFRLPSEVWKLLDRKLSLTADAAHLREHFPWDFIRYVLSKCERGEDVVFSQFEGADDAPYDLYLQYYDRCWQALAQDDAKQAEQCIKSADELNIRHPIMEICRAEVLTKNGKPEEAIALLEGLEEKYPSDAMICYNTAENLWRQKDADGGRYRKRAAELYMRLKKENDSHYMANLRLTEWYYDNNQYKTAKECAEKVLVAGGGDDFLELLRKVNARIEEELEVKWRREEDHEAALELCWCYLQDGRFSRGEALALQLKDRLPDQKDAEWKALMAKLYVEGAEYGAAIEMSRAWEEALKEKLAGEEKEEEREKDKDRLRQAHLIRMQCNHNLGYRDRDKFAEAIREGEAVLEGKPKDIGVLLEMAQIYVEMQEYEKCEETVSNLVEDYQIYAAYASSMEAYRRQLNAGGVIRTGSLCVQYFPNFAKAYEYMAKVYLDLERFEDLEKIFEEAEKNGVKSTVLEAYRFQKDHKPMEPELLNNSLKQFRKNFRKPLEEGKTSFYEEGIKKLTKYLYHCPDSYMFVERGIFRRAGHHYAEAKEDFEKAISMNPSNPYAHNGLSFVYKYTGDYEKALIHIRKAILYMDEDMSPIIYTDLADLYSLLGRHEKALAVCRLYEEQTHDTAAWFLKQLAEIYVNLGRGQEAREIYQKCCQKVKWELYEKQVDASVKCGEEKEAARILQTWSGELGIRKGILADILPAGRGNASGNRESVLYYVRELWYSLVFGTSSDVEKCVRRLRKLQDTEDGCEGRMADVTFACILCGLEKEGRKSGAQLAKWLRKETYAEKDRYFNREKGKLQIKILAAWYTEPEEKISGLLDSEASCGICHFCTSAVCREVEAVRILFLLRRNKTREALERLNRCLELLPSDEYMRAIKHRIDRS